MRESREEYGERLELVMERIAQIAEKPEIREPFASYFRAAASYQLAQYEVYEKAVKGELLHLSVEEGCRINRSLYAYFEPANYSTGYADHAFCAAMFAECPQTLEQETKLCANLLAAFFASLKGNNAQLCKGTARNICIYAELFVELFSYFAEAEETGILDVKNMQECMRSFMHDYSELFMENNIASILDPEFASVGDIIMEANLTDPAYLYRYGMYVSENELAAQQLFAEMPEEEVQAMADTFTEGYRIGFTVMNKNLSIKKTVQIVYPLGFERMIRRAVKNYEKIGLDCTFNPYTTSVNKQMDYDHREDNSLWTDKEITEYRIECHRNALDKYKKIGPLFGGPDVIEVFGEEPFSPVSKPENPHFNEEQQKLSVYFRSSTSQNLNKCIHGEERSFSVIAYPVAAIGPQFKEIFAETVKLNTLDYIRYRNIQQKIIDLLDTGDRVHVVGMNGNRTDMTVNLWKLKNPEKETIFENCVADVNIPLGEVFTSPVLEGTYGKLHVTQVYLEDYNFKNLEIDFRDGMITSYTCSNFAEEEQNQKYIQDNILFHHPTLPIGEFAIGTNTTAYRMGKIFGIQDKLPILIAEKTGPHFAVGDTCYPWEEDCKSYNPDGKEVVAKENSISALRHEDPAKAYFNCHTDITIPYNELGAITLIRKDGTSEDIIRNGRFVLPGTEELNEPLDELDTEM